MMLLLSKNSRISRNQLRQQKSKQKKTTENERKIIIIIQTEKGRFIINDIDINKIIGDAIDDFENKSASLSVFSDPLGLYGL